MGYLLIAINFEEYITRMFASQEIKMMIIKIEYISSSLMRKNIKST